MARAATSIARHWPTWLVGVAILVAGGPALGTYVSELLLQRLTYARHLQGNPSPPATAVYILGGTPESLQAKLRIASTLVHGGIAGRVLVPSDPGLMAFSPALERNPTVNEWVVEELGVLGVAPEAIEFIAIDEGFFGTWSEAWGVSRLLRKHPYKHLVLVTSGLHSRRAWESFSRAIEQPGTDLFLYLSDEPAHLRHVVTECAKLIFYRALLF